MLSFNILSLFPELISGYFKDSILKKAVINNIININFFNLRDFSLNKHKQVDDTPYGGGAGMLLRVDVLGNAVDKIKDNYNVDKVILLSPKGEKLNFINAKTYAKDNYSYLLVCARYEGVDQRFIDLFVDQEISIGDYVLSGGELASAVFIESVSRFLPGVVGNKESIYMDSFENNLLKYPQYTKPPEYRGLKVPEVLRTGNHENIKKWRNEKALNITKAKRKDLL